MLRPKGDYALPMPSPPAPWDVYKEAFAPHHRGYPLWEPSPIYSYQRVRLGDVGYIREGRFHLLFSAGAGLRTRGTGTDVPPNFVPLDVGPIIREVRPSGYLRTDTVRQIGVNVNNVDSSLTVSRPVEPGVTIEFELTSRKGAALITNHPTYCEKMERIGRAEDYLEEHYGSWEQFARQQGHGDVKPILVTGVALTKQFASMAYSDHNASLRCNFSVGNFSGRTGWGSWRTQDPLVHTNCGPFPPPQGNQGRVSGSSVPPDHNQCVFIYPCTRRRRLLGFRFLRAQAGPHQLPREDPGDDGAAGVVAVKTVDPDDKPVKHASTNVTHEARPDDLDDFDIVAEFIFGKTRAESLLMHYTDIQGLVHVNGSEKENKQLLEDSGIVKRVEVDKNGVGKLVPMT